MHCALEIQEILYNIFGHCHDPDNSYSRENSDLAALARTCRTFKEPALDVLWEELDNLSPLARCLPEASHKLTKGRSFPEYSLCKSLTQTQWDTIRSYTRRIRFICMQDISGLNEKSIRNLSKQTEPLFPNLRHLEFGYTPSTMPLLLLPLPSLISARVLLYTLRLFHNSLKSFARATPNLRELFIDADSYADARSDVELDVSGIPPDYIRQWGNLRAVVCPGFFLDANTLVHLSRMPALTQLSFRLRNTLPAATAPSDSPLIFANLRDFSLESAFLGLVLRLLPQIRLPAITAFSTSVENCPSKRDLSSFLTGIGRTIQNLRLHQADLSIGSDSPENEFVLGWKDLQPCTLFTNLRTIDLSIQWKVALTESELLKLASAWPHLEQLFINTEWGWNTQGGITPDGLLRLLQTCRFLNSIALAIDTRGYTECHLSSANFGSPLPSGFYINVVDSFIEAKTVPAIAAFFAGILPRTKYSFRAWQSWRIQRSPYWGRYGDHWAHVSKRIHDALG